MLLNFEGTHAPKTKETQMINVTVEQWKEMFSKVGLTEADMNKWHQIFEQSNPEGHKSFLEWLMPDDAQWVEKVRTQSK